MTPYSRLLPAALVSLWCLASPVMADDNTEANRLFVSAVTLYNEGGPRTGDPIADLEGSVVRLQQIRDSLDRIVSDYSGSQLAVQLVIGEQVGPLSRRAIERELRVAEDRLETERCSRVLTRACVISEALEVARNVPHVSYGALADVALERADLAIFEEALDVARRIDPGIFRDMAIAYIAGLQARAGFMTEAFETARGLEGTISHGSALRSIAIAQVASGLFSEALDTAQRLEGEDRDRVLDFLATVQADPASITERLETRRRDQLAYHRERAPSGIAEVLVDPALFPEALEAARAIEEPGDRRSALVAMVWVLADAGLTEEALETARSVDDLGDRVQALLVIARTMPE